MKRILLLISLLACLKIAAQDNGNMKLWYSRPAKAWTEALPIGNSKMGAMVFGGTEQEELQLNEETFWAGGPYQNNNPKGHEALAKVRELIFSDKFKEAQQLIDENFFTGQHGMSYLTLGSLLLDFPGHDAATGYYRELDIANAMATTRYAVDGVNYVRTVFASMADSVIIMRLEADKPQALDFALGYNRDRKSVV